MAFSAAFSVSLIGTSTLLFTDTSTGSDATITERRIYLYKYDNTTIVPDGVTTDYIPWPIADTTITLTDILAGRDYAINQDVIWVTATPDPGSTYEAEVLQLYDANAYVFGGTLLAQRLARNPLQTNDNNFDMNEAIFMCNISQSENAVLTLQNIGLAQAALDKLYYKRINTLYYF